MADNFILDWTPGLDVAVLIYNVQERRYELALVDTSTESGRFKLAMFQAGRNLVWTWQVNWYSEIVH